MATDNRVALARQGRGASSHLSRTARQVVPAFLQKLYEMVNDSHNDELIKWSEAGDSFYVLDHERFSHEVLGRWFKHKNFSSFVRQLNMYGFHKIPHLQQGVLKSETDTELWNFEHPHFRRGQPDMLCLIQRKKQPTTGNAPLLDEQPLVAPREIINQNQPALLQSIPPGQVLDINSVVNGIAAIKRHQQAISADLSELKTSNQHLWKEAMASRERHKKHQDTINRILKFLAGVFGHSATSPVHKHDDSDSPHPVVPRKRQRLMIADSSDEKSKGASVADDVDEDDRMLDHDTSPSMPTPFASIATPPPSDLFSPGPLGSSALTDDTYLSMDTTSRNPDSSPSAPPHGGSTSTQPSALTSFSPNRATSPNTTELLQSAFNQMMNSPQQMQRLLQALSQNNFPIPSQPPPQASQASMGTEANNQLTAYSAPFSFDSLSQNDDINNPNYTALFSLSSQNPQSPTLNPPKMDDLKPLFSDHEVRLQKSWTDTSRIAANVDLMDSNIKSFIDDFGFDPILFSNVDDNSQIGNNGGDGALAGSLGKDHIDGGGIDKSCVNGTLNVSADGGSVPDDTEFDFEDLWTRFSRQDEHDTDYGDLKEQLAATTVTDDGQETERLTAFLDDVASETASISNHSSKQQPTSSSSPSPLLSSGQKKRKLDGIDITDIPTLKAHSQKT